jgi:hypothetical protein
MTGLRLMGALFIAAIGVGLMAGPAMAQAVMPKFGIPHLEQWQKSPHANAKAEAFNHWNNSKDKMVEEACARCHTTTGFEDYIGADGSTPWKMDKPAPIGQVIECVACHNKVASHLTQVTFPSGTTVKGLGASARCMTCHQGRESTISVNDATKGIEDDAVSNKLKFINIHYRAAAATKYGTIAKGAYEYPGKAYAGVYDMDKEHGVSQCIDCHNPHTTQLNPDDCSVCHRDVRGKEDFKFVRGKKDKGDYDGSGDMKEGIGQAVDNLKKALMVAMQAYAKDVVGHAIAYDPNTYPYFMNDTNGNGTADKDEASFKNQYKHWTPRLLRAAYNYQFVEKDPGAFAHNPPYIIQILHDSIADLATKAKLDIAMDKMARP